MEDDWDSENEEDESDEFQLENCPICGEASEEGDEGYCWNCKAHICPICQHPCKINYRGTVCSHYVLTFYGGTGFVEDQKNRDNGLLQADDFADFISKNVPHTASTCEDGLDWATVYFHSDGGDIAWENFVPVLEQQKAGRGWLHEQVF